MLNDMIFRGKEDACPLREQTLNLSLLLEGFRPCRSSQHPAQKVVELGVNKKNYSKRLYLYLKLA